MIRDRDQSAILLNKWAKDEFGTAEANNTIQRAIRLLEESIEAYQATGADQAMAHKLVDYVFSRPVGELRQELGGVGVTLLLLGEAAGISANIAEWDEIERIRMKPPGSFKRRNEEKNAAGFKSGDIR